MTLCTYLGSNTLEMVQESGDTVMLRGSANTTVVAEPTQTWNTTVGMDLWIPAAPEQYSKYEWRIGGKTVSTESVLKYTFDAVGTYSVECLMTDPVQKAERAFRRVVWNVEVR